MNFKKIKLNEVFKMSEAGGPKWDKTVKEFYDAALKIRETAAGSLQAQAPDAFGQGDRRGVFTENDAREMIELVDKLIDVLKKNSSVQVPFSDIEF